MKEAAEDCVVPTDSGERLTVPKGTLLAPMTYAMHHNRAWKHSLTYSHVVICPAAKYWPDPYEFRPSRFLGDYNKDAFIPFSAGARGCIGRRYVPHWSGDNADRAIRSQVL